MALLEKENLEKLSEVKLEGYVFYPPLIKGKNRGITEQKLVNLLKQFKSHSSPKYVLTSPAVYYLEGIRAFMEELYKLGIKIEIKKIGKIKFKK